MYSRVKFGVVGLSLVATVWILGTSRVVLADDGEFLADLTGKTVSISGIPGCDCSVAEKECKCHVGEF